ncbi:MAG: N-formylglutamate amidohydrolase [Alphaproteobacteria bacterium]|nr:N-formylglutamate amidohydrolase [Alphaproteobacteria bacterium]
MGLFQAFWKGINALDTVVICQKPERQSAPLVLDSPHSGSRYPEDFGHACPQDWLRATEDSYVDEIFAAAPALGAPLLCAQFPRCYIDANRAEDDIDPKLLDRPMPHARPTARSQMGVGLIRRIYKQSDPRPIYDRRLTAREVEGRIARCYRPYHAALKALLDATFEDFGAVFHLNCHSMPGNSGTWSADGKGLADMVLGDRDGSTCDAGFTAHARASLEAMGYRVAVNNPYKGVEIIRRYGRPRKNRHSLQLEIHRGLYMDEASRLKTPGFAKLQKDMGQLVSQLIDYTRKNSLDLAAD